MSNEKLTGKNKTKLKSMKKGKLKGIKQEKLDQNSCYLKIHYYTFNKTVQ